MALVSVLTSENKSFQAKNSSLFRQRKLLVISFDGLSAEYLSQIKPKYFENLGRNGAKAKSLQPSFPTKTFPNHLTLVTGLYPESHGIVSNMFFDPIVGRIFDYSRDGTNASWYMAGEPIWNTAKRQGLRTAAMLWPGSDADINGMRPDIWWPWSKANQTTPLDRMKQAVQWLKGDFDLVCLYLEHVDVAGHVYGPGSEQVRKAILEMDETIGYLLGEISNDEKLQQNLNLMIMSDHGMAQLDSEKIIEVGSDYLDMSLVEIAENWPNLFLWPHNPQDTRSIYDKLKKFQRDFDANGDKFHFYLREEIPVRFHFQHNRRISPILGIPKSPYAFSINKDNQILITQDKIQGNHGFDHEDANMQAVFYTQGPSFRKNPGIILPKVQNTELYQLMCHVLGITPSINNGTVEGMEVFSRTLSE